MQNHDYTQDKSTAPKDVREATSTFTHERKKFATQMDARLLQRLRDYAKSEGRQIQSVLEEAVEMMFLDHKQAITRILLKRLRRFGRALCKTILLWMAINAPRLTLPCYS